MPYGDLTKQAVQRFARYEDLEAADCDDRGARGVRAAPRRGQPRLRRHRLRGDPRRGRAGGRRDPLGRRQQRHAVHPAGPAHRRRRPAPARPRAPLPPGRDEPAHGRRLRREQDRQRRRRRGSTPCSTRSASTTRDATVVLAASPFHVEGDAAEIEGKRVLAIEDGPTLTHGEMTYGAAVLAAKQHGAAELVDPRPFAVGSIAETFERVPARRHAAAGDGLRREQIEDLRETIERSDADLVLIGTPIDLRADRLRQARPARHLPAGGGRRADARRRARRAGPARRRARVTHGRRARRQRARPAGERGTAAEQRANLRGALRGARAAARGRRSSITHGNGPQVGNELLRQERAADEAPPLPLWLAVAQTQAEIGALIEAELAGAGRPRGRVRAHARPRRRGRPRVRRSRRSRSARSTRRERGGAPRARARLARSSRTPAAAGAASCPRPQPLEIVELDAVRRAPRRRDGHVACGGGGIPVVAPRRPALTASTR